MKALKCLLTYVFSLTLGVGLLIPSSAFASGKGAWAIITDVDVRWVEYPGSAGALLYDRETGLVWEQSPATTIPSRWINAAAICMNKKYPVNGRQVQGFRLPTVAELTSLTRDLFGGPFDNIQGSVHVLGNHFDNFYMSSEVVHNDSESGFATGSSFWAVSYFLDGNQQLIGSAQLRGTEGPANVPDGGGEGWAYRVMCVRGGGGNHSGNTHTEN
jgi:hypothetical protein